jgi:hypothetical protein
LSLLSKKEDLQTILIINVWACTCVKIFVKLPQSVQLHVAPLLRKPHKDSLYFRFCIAGSAVSFHNYRIGRDPKFIFSIRPRNVLNWP